MMAARPGTVDLAIQHMRQPGQRMPVARMKTERPDESPPSQPRLHQRVVRHILLVIVFDKTVVKHRQVKQQSDQSQGQTDQSPKLRIVGLHFHAGTMMLNQTDSSMANDRSNS